jgi:hypothetical protein
VLSFGDGWWLLGSAHQAVDDRRRTFPCLEAPAQITFRDGTSYRVEDVIDPAESWIGGKDGPDLMLLRLKPGQWDIAKRALNLSAEAVEAGDVVYGSRVEADGSVTTVQCHIDHASGDIVRTDCGGEPGWSGTIWVDEDGNAVAVHSRGITPELLDQELSRLAEDDDEESETYKASLRWLKANCVPDLTEECIKRISNLAKLGGRNPRTSGPVARLVETLRLVGRRLSLLGICPTPTPDATRTRKATATPAPAPTAGPTRMRRARRAR